MADSNRLRWDLDSVFEGGSDSKEFSDFRRKLAEDIAVAREKLDSLPLNLEGNNLKGWTDLVALLRDVSLRQHHAEGYTYCLAAQDVNDTRAMTILDELTAQDAEIEGIMIGIEALALAVDDKAWEELVSQPELAEASFRWKEIRRHAKLKMEPRLEKLATDLAVNGLHSWNLLYTKMAGDLRAELTVDGKTEELSMGQLSNKMSSPDRDIRKQAFDKLEEAWHSTDSLAALELNAIAGFRLSLYRNRGWDDPLQEAFMMARVRPDTVEAMWKAVSGGLDRVTRYIEARKRRLGIDDFRWYDQTAPIPGSDRTLTYDEAADFVVKHLGSFSPDMGEFARMAIDNRWIEAEDRSGKMAGGFCTGLPVVKQSRIFMTFSGNYDETMTLAHELGHAYHSWVLKDKDYFARRYPMTLAETASTFNEMLVTDAALAAAADEEEKLALLDKKLQEHFIMFCNIYARYLFETRFYHERGKGSVPKERLNEIMVQAQKDAYGSILAEDGYHPVFWASKLHFSETGVPFYNYPYTFGHLFAGGIYDRAKKEGPGFAEKYKALLADTGSMTCEEVARNHLGVDLAAGGFWTDAVDRALSDVDTFIKLAG
jgi:pepF/M3 family oligoendopeptidase